MSQLNQAITVETLSKLVESVNALNLVSKT